MKPGCFPALFPGFRTCIEKLAYTVLKLPSVVPHPVACEGGRFSGAPGRNRFSSAEWVGSRLCAMRMGDTGGLAHPLISLQRCLYSMITYLGVTFWNGQKRAYLIINPSQKSFASHRLWKETDFDKLHLMYIVKSLQSWGPALWIFSHLIFPKKGFLKLQISGGADKKQKWDVLLELYFQEPGGDHLKI